MLKDDSLVSYSAQFLSENLTVVLIIFYVNFLSSRKYDWNVAPKDLEKIRRAHGACVVFFFKKNKSLFTLTTTRKNKRIKKYFSTCLLFHFLSCSYYYYNTKQSTLKFNNVLFIKKVSRKIFQKYTKSFGGKIWANLHSVSPDNIFETIVCKTCL